MVEVIYHTSSGSNFYDRLDACRDDFKWLRNRRDTLCRSLVRMKRENLPDRTKKYLLARKEAGEKRECVRKNDDPGKRYLVKKAYFETLSKKFETLNDLQIEIRVYKKLRAEYKQRAEECRKALELCKELEAKEIK